MAVEHSYYDERSFGEYPPVGNFAEPGAEHLNNFAQKMGSESRVCRLGAHEIVLQGLKCRALDGGRVMVRGFNQNRKKVAVVVGVGVAIGAVYGTYAKRRDH